MKNNSPEKILIVHIEDDEDWRAVIQDIVYSYPSVLEYQGVDSTEIGWKLLNNLDRPAIAIFDLRLDVNELGEFKTILEISTNVRELMKKGIDIFILSGHLTDTNKIYLRNQGIPFDHIFDKGKAFNEFIFTGALLKAFDLISTKAKKVKDRTIRLIHLSDLHIGQEFHNRLLHNDVRDELLNDIKKIKNKLCNIDGSLGISGVPARYRGRIK